MFDTDPVSSLQPQVLTCVIAWFVVRRKIGENMAALEATLSRGARERRKPTVVSHQYTEAHAQNSDSVARPSPMIARGVAVSEPYFRPQ